MSAKIAALFLVACAALLVVEAGSPQKRDAPAQTDATKAIDDIMNSLKTGVQSIDLSKIDVQGFFNNLSEKVKELGSQAKEAGDKLFTSQKSD